jgi:hypothetical protein
LIAFVIVLSMSAVAHADIIVSGGYYDLSPAASGGGPPLPNPWFGSANTTFSGSATDLSDAVASDPDISALLFQNTGATNVTLSALSLSPKVMDVWLRAGDSSVTLAPGQNYIFAVGDGSDIGLSGQTISATLNGTGYSFADATTSLAPDGVLFGNVPQLGGGDETQPWTQDAVLLHSGTSAVPEPSSYVFLIAAFLVWVEAKTSNSITPIADAQHRRVTRYHAEGGANLARSDVLAVHPFPG